MKCRTPILRAYRPARCILLLAIIAIAGVTPTTTDAQSMRGRVLDDENDRPVPTALVRLVDATGEERGVTAADSTGGYRMELPEPGVYRLVAERLGYEPFETPLLDAASPEGVYQVDLLMRRAPLPIPGLEVSTERVERQIRLLTGVSPRSLRNRPLFREVIVDHLDKAHDLVALMRWEAPAGVTVEAGNPLDGPCFRVRQRTCLPVYLNGFPIAAGLVPVLPLDMVNTLVIMMPGESVPYAGGGVLLYTAAWLR